MKIKRFIIGGIIVLLIFASFTSLFYLSAVFDSKKEVENFVHSLGFHPFFTIYLSTPTMRFSRANSTKLSLDPFQQLLVAGGEISPQSILLYTNKSHRQESSASTFDEIRKLPVNFLTKDDVRKIRVIKGVKQAFIFNPTDSLFNEKIRYKNSPLIPVFAVPPGFIKNVGLKLKYGRYFSNNENDKHEIILTYEISKLLFGDKNPVGTILKGYRGDYEVIGVLGELNDYQYFSMYGIASGGYIALPGDYVPYNASSASFGYDKFRQIENRIIVLPEPGAEKSVKNKISAMLKDKGYKKIVYPVIYSTYDDAKKILGVSLRMQKFLVIAVTGFAVSVLSWFIVWAFVELEILTKIKEIFIKRAIGATRKAIFYAYFNEFVVYGIASLFVAICIFFLSEPKLSELNVGNTGINVPIGSGEIIHKIGLSYNSVVITFCILLAILLSSVSRETFFGFSKSLINWLNVKLFGLKKSKKLFFALIAIMLSFSSFLSVFVIRYNLKVSVQNMYNECVPGVIRISSTGNTGNKLILLPLGVINYPDYNYSDYKALKNFLGDKAVVGFRSTLPFYSALKFKNEDLKVRISDCTPDFTEIYNLHIGKGRFVSESDISKKNYVCVIGSNVSKSLHCNLGERLLQYKVVGILSPENELIDNTVFVPLGILNQSVRNVSGSGASKTEMFYIKVANSSLRNKIGEEALAFLNKRHSGKTSGLLIDLTKIFNQITLIYMPLYSILSIFTFLALLSSFLSLSALLFIEVIRRTREIGIKKAIGATSKEITKEFTLKGLKTTMIALSIGIPAGILISLIIEKIKGWSYYIPVNILILVISVSLLLGFIFSFLPAYFASKTNPVEAIKSE